MKRVFFSLTVMAALLFTACSGDDSGASSSSNSFVSTIEIDGQPYVPTAPQGTIRYTNTSVQPVPATSNFLRVFSLIKMGTSLDNIQQFDISVTYPASQGTVDGTYHFAIPGGGSPANAAGFWGQGMNQNIFKGGTVTVEDLGNSKYKLTFNNTVMGDMADESAPITVTGYCEGFFTEQTPE